MRIQALYILGICITTATNGCAMETERLAEKPVDTLVQRTVFSDFQNLSDESFKPHFLRLEENFNNARVPCSMETSIKSDLVITRKPSSDYRVHTMKVIILCTALSLQQHKNAAADYLAKAHQPFYEIRTNISFNPDKGPILDENDFTDRDDEDNSAQV